MCLNDETASWALEGDSYTSTVNAQTGPTFNGTPAGAPWISVVSFVLASGQSYNIDALKTAVGLNATSRTIRLRVILDEIVYGPLPDAGPGGTIALEAEPLAAYPNGSTQSFSFST